jgi:hypothetical protein
MPRSKAEANIKFVRHAFRNLESEHFKFSPDPFGSVIVFENPVKDNQFGLVDCPLPYMGLGIALPKHRILTVLFSDRGLVKQEFNRIYRGRGGASSIVKSGPNAGTEEVVRILMLKLVMRQYWFKNIPYGVKLNETSIVSNRVPSRPKYKRNVRRDTVIDIALVTGFTRHEAQTLANDFESRGMLQSPAVH